MKLVNWRPMDVPEDRKRIFICTKIALQILACPADIQVRFYPDFVCVTDELALDFDHWHSLFVGNYGVELTAAQLAGFTAIKERFESLGRCGKKFNEGFWTDDALRESADWEVIRQLATKTLTLLGWPVETPVSTPGTYVRGA